MIRWARERAAYDIRDLAARFPKLLSWERGEKQPTFKQLDAFATATHTPERRSLAACAQSSRRPMISRGFAAEPSRSTPDVW